jgi:hypothetical protein
MTDFKATNNFNLIRFAFYERLRYKLNAFENTPHTNIKQINFSDLAFYGRTTLDHEAIYLDDQSVLKQVEAGIPAVSFVADAFIDLKQHFKTAVSLELISPNEKFLSNLTCYNGYDDPINLFSQHMKEIFYSYNNDYLKKIKVRSINDYIDNLIPFMKKLASEFPINFSSWIKNKKCSPFVSGIYINVSTNNCGDDTLKESDFINSPNFDFYVNTCKSRGFYVSESNPNIIIADLNSEPMRKFMEPYGFQSISSLFRTVYLPAYTRDIEFLSSMLIEYYNKYIENNKIVTSIKISRNNKIYTQIDYNNNNTYNINNNILIKLYTNIKNIEEDYVFGQADINRFIKNAKNLEKKIDMKSAIRYINREFKSTYLTRHGGLNYYLNKTTSED